jgi:transposase
MKNVYYVGLDVHKETIEVSVFCNWNKEPEFEKRIENNHGKLLKILRHLQEDGHVTVCYEAGCMGFTLKRVLDEEAIECCIVSPGKLPRKPGERIKTDRRDARMLAKLLRSGEAEPIYIPTHEDEAVRDYLRTREDVRKDLTRAKHQLLKFLLRQRHRYGQGRNWTQAHRKWMRDLQFAHQLHRETFETYYMRVIELEEHLAFMDAKIEDIAHWDRYYDSVARLRCFKGIDYLIALSIVCEVGDFNRFPDAASFMSYLGLVPREHSSGNTRRQGSITKSGNSHLRFLLVEASWHYRYKAPPGKGLTARRIGQSTEIVAYADKAMRRLQKKFGKLIYKGKSGNCAVVAVSRELAGFIWGVMNNKIAT